MSSEKLKVSVQYITDDVGDRIVLMALHTKGHVSAEAMHDSLQANGEYDALEELDGPAYHIYADVTAEGEVSFTADPSKGVPVTAIAGTYTAMGHVLDSLVAGAED